MDAISIATGGLMSATARFDASASRTARMGATDPTTGTTDDSVDAGQEAVTQIEAKQQFSANVGVIRIANEMWNSLLDLQKA
jgi:flagellar basal body rod protein FlgC